MHPACLPAHRWIFSVRRDPPIHQRVRNTRGYEGNCPEKDEEEIKESESEEEKGENNALVYISVIISIIIFIAVLVVIYLKCCKKERYVKIPSGDLSIGDKNIPFDDENEDGIN